jgi:hypothetical protein
MLMHGLLEPRRGTVASLWAIVLVAVLLRAWIQPNRNSVLPIFARAGQCWERAQNLYTRPAENSGSDRYRYAPGVAAFFAPLSHLPPTSAEVAWRLLNAAVLLTGFFAFVRTVVAGRTPLDNRTASWLGLLLLPLSILSLNNGQPNPLLIGCMLFGLVAVARERWWLAALCLSVPVLFKVYPVALVLLLLLIHPAKLGPRVALILALGLLLPFLLHDPGYVAEQYRNWFAELTADERLERSGAAGYRDFRLLLGLAGLPLSPRAYLPLQLAAAAGCALLVLLGRASGRRQEDLLHEILDLGCCWMTLFGPATESASYTLLAPTLALAGWQAAQLGRSVWTRMTLIAIVSLFLGSLAATALPGGKMYAYFLNPLAALLLCVERLVYLTLRREPATATEPTRVIVGRVHLGPEAVRGVEMECVEAR